MKTQVVFPLRAPPLHHQAERHAEGKLRYVPGERRGAASLRQVCSMRTVVLTCHVVRSGGGTGRRLRGNAGL